MHFQQKIPVFSSDNKSIKYNTPSQPSISPFNFSTDEGPSFKQAR